MTEIQADFLQDEGARGMIAALTAAGEEARFVGGCVRDALAGLPLGEIDLATTALPEKVMAVLETVGFSVKPVGLAHGVVLALRDGRKYEIATLREDVQTDGRHAVVAFTRDWELDAQRRDFTINALSADIHGKVFDYTGGVVDLSARRVKFIGDAATRIREDYLRILRFYRFQARFGAEWDAAARAACRDNISGIAQLSRERVTEELVKLLSLENPIAACAAMTEDEVLLGIIPWLRGIPSLEKLLKREKDFDLQLPWLARLFAWAGFAAVFQEKQLDEFIFTRAARVELKLLATMDLSDLNAALYHHGAANVCMSVLLRADDAALTSAMLQIENYQPREFLFQAEDLLQMGIQPGPRLGEILRAVEDWWLKGGCVADRAACKDYAATLATVSKE